MSSEKSRLSTESCDQDQSSHHVEINQQLSTMRPTFVEIIQQRNPFDNFLLNSSIGQKLVSHGLFKDPLIKAQTKYGQDVNVLAQKFHQLGLAASQVEATKIALNQPDLRPRDANTIYLETLFNNAFQDRQYKVEHGDIDRQASDYLDLEEELGQVIQSISDQTKTQVYQSLLPTVISDQKVVYLRDRILEFIQTENWSWLLDLLSNNYDKQPISAELSQVLNTLSPSFFLNPKFRHYALQFIIRFRVDKGAKAMENFDEYLANLGLSFSDPAECRRYADMVYLRRELDRQWNRREYPEFFQLVDFLYKLNLFPSEFFTEEYNPDFFINYYQFALLSLYGKSNSNFKKELNAMAESWGIPPEFQISLNNQDRLYSGYRSLCEKNGLPIDPQLQKIFSPQPTKPSGNR